MAAMRGPRLQPGSATWVAEERAATLKIVDTEIDEFTYNAQIDFEWLNEHMNGIFNENETNFVETFKTPGKLQGKTPRTTRKLLPTESRVPLSDVFGGTPSSSANRLAQHLAAQSPQVQNSPPKATLASSPRRLVDSPKPNQVQQATTKPHPAPQDSGYFGSQDVNPVNADSIDENEPTMPFDEEMADGLPTDAISSPAHNSYMNKTTHFAEQEQPARELTQGPGHGVTPLPTRNNGNSPQQAPLSHVSSPTKARTEEDIIEEDENEAASQHSAQPSSGDARSNSDGSSPVRHPVIRKSSLNFASLPAREPLTAGKSVGARVSRTSHLDANRTSYYSRHTGGKSLGHIARHDESEEEEEEDQDQDEMDVDDFPPVPSPPKPSNEEDVAVHHNKTYTQRLQDQINLLGKSQPNGGRSSKSIQGLANAQQPAAVAQPAPEPKSPSPRKQEMTTTPGAFPEDEDDDWIDPPAPELVAQQSSTPRPTLSKSYSTDVMEGIHSKQTLGAPEMEEYETANKAVWTSASPQRPNVLGHGKSASVPAVPLTVAASMQHGSPLSKTVSASIPAGVLSSISQTSPVRTPGKSPSRHFRESPLKHVKNQLSSFFGRGRDLLASSAALSAEGKASIISPSSARLELHTGPSSDTIATKASFASKKTDVGSFAPGREKSPSRPVAKRTRASVEREKEEKRREKEAKIMADQMDKLEDAREKEREKARVFSKEQERIVSMEKQISSKKENENPTLKETPKQTRTSPRKAATQQETSSKPTEQDTEMADAPSAVPAFVPRSAGPNQGPRPKELRRPLKPAKEPLAKPKPVPTVIRVNTGSQHSQFLPSGSNASAGFQEPPASTGSQLQQPLTSKASKASLQPKPSSSQSFKSSTSSNGRPKALELAARKKEQDEREAQRRRDLKADMERKRAVAQEEQKKQEQQRRLEAERQKQSQREQAEAKKTAQRQAAIEKAKQTRAPPPAVRGQPTGPPDYKSTQDKVGSVQRGDGPPSRPPSRMNSGIYRPQEDGGRQFNGMHSNAPKAVPKRPLGQDGNEERQARHAPSRGGPQYQTQDAKRRRTSDDFADELEMDNPPNIKGPPVRPSGGFKQDLQTKSMFQNGYGNVPPSATRDLFKAAVTAQHVNQAKAAHPLDMAQISKGAIPFAPNPNSAGSSFKTPARPGAAHGMKSAAKSVQRSSPRFQNGDAIELPEIQTDDEDDEDDEPPAGTVAAWADSPELRRALMGQETMDPSQIFGPPAPLVMEEVFSKSKDKWHKFRARTSSANWSGSDRLTEDDIRKDLAARDKLRRDGGWSYEMSRDMM